MKIKHYLKPITNIEITVQILSNGICITDTPSESRISVLFPTLEDCEKELTTLGYMEL